MTADRWMSYAEIAERLRVRLEETVELLAENEPPLPPRLEPDINYVAAANRTTIALDIVALQHAVSICEALAKAYSDDTIKRPTR